MELDPSLFYEYWGRWNSPYINHFISADTIVPAPNRPQSLNRYSYVVNNPINAIDPTGHICIGEPEECLGNDGTMSGGFNGTGGTVSNPSAGNCSGSGCQGNENDDSDDGDGYSGPLPSDIQSLLLSHGANPELLASVTIYVTIEDAGSACGSNQLATTVNSNIYICTLADNNGDVVYDPHEPTPVLLHELVHVRQFRDNKIGTWIEIAIVKVRKALNEDYNPYKESWVEIEGSACQSAYKANPGIPLDSGACNLK